MDKAAHAFILDVINQANDLTLATIRADGYPQATTVSYASDGLTIYVGIGKHSQKAKNIERCDKVSLTIDLPYRSWDEIKGLSMGATAQIMSEQAEIDHALACIIKKFPETAQWSTPDERSEMCVLKITPKVISVLDYSKGFGHTELVTV